MIICLLLLGSLQSLGLVQASTSGNLCIPYTASEKVTLAYINDGDTLTLKDGRLIRLIGVNAPEIDHQYPSLSQRSVWRPGPLSPLSSKRGTSWR
ncbi:hypothetical protein [Shewanella algae]|uniref:hypothetical protein n=1 Tax=Shewanella algae TaxID=38313 RepID=UPI0031F4CB4F